MRRAALLAVGLVCGLASVSRAQFAPGPRGEVLHYGLCEHGADRNQYLQPDSAAGYGSIGDVRLLDPTDTVPLREGVGFGIEWKASGLPDRAQLVFSYRISHPRIVRPDGRALTVTTQELPLRIRNGEIRTTDCYFLSEQHELVAGEWEIAIWFQGQRLAAKRFNVRAPL